MNDILQNYTFGLPIQASTFASRIDASLNILHAAMVLIFVLWSLFFVYCLIRFRRGRQPRAQYLEHTGGLASLVPDALVLGFEIWLIFAVGLPIWSQVKEDFPEPSNALTINMVAEQFAWGFQYAGADNQFGKTDPKQINPGNTFGIDSADPAAADDIVVLNELHVPLGRPTMLNMTSKDVIHSFFVPEFRVKQDTVPGMKIPLWFEPTKTGRFEIGCAQLCGLGHYRMRGDVYVHTPEEFEAWKQEKIKERQAEEAS